MFYCVHRCGCILERHKFMPHFLNTFPRLLLMMNLYLYECILKNTQWNVFGRAALAEIAGQGLPVADERDFAAGDDEAVTIDRSI